MGIYVPRVSFFSLYFVICNKRRTNTDKNTNSLLFAKRTPTLQAHSLCLVAAPSLVTTPRTRYQFYIYLISVIFFCHRLVYFTYFHLLLLSSVRHLLLVSFIARINFQFYQYICSQFFCSVFNTKCDFRRGLKLKQ